MITLDTLDLQTITPSELGELLIDAKKAYYTSGKPIMDDHTYDTLEDILRQKNPHHRFFQKIGTPNFDTGWPKHSHTHPMNSQNKVNNFVDLVKYFQLKKVSADGQFVVQPKCDGLSVELVYQNGRVTDAITRGDGRTGDSILQNVCRMQNFVDPLPQKFSGSIRCEIIVTFKDFDQLNHISVEKYSNTRNAASGLSQRLDSQYSELCTLMAVDILPEPPTEHQKIEILQQLHVKTVDHQLCTNLTQVDKAYQQFLDHRSSYPFDIDGIVVKINDLSLAKQLGSLNNRPKFQVAYKFPAAVNTTRLLTVDWQTGPMGNITPVAQIEPIEISGAIINYVSLANFDLIKQLNLNLGDIVEVSRRGDVIPHIDKVVTKVNSGHLSPPTTCPSCHNSLITDHKFLKCPNKFCPAQTLGVLKLFCQTLDIKNISDKTIQKLVTAGKIKLPGDFYDLTLADFSHLEGLGPKSGQNIIDQIQAKKHLTLIQIFDAANIPHFSARRIQQLIDAGFNTPQKIQNLTPALISQVPGFKITLANKIIAGLTVRQPIIGSILGKVTLVNSRKSGKLNHLGFVITGQLSKSRQDIEQTIVDHGGQVHSAVNQSTDYLLTNSPSTSSKYLTAVKLGVKIINESDFQKLL